MWSRNDFIPMWNDNIRKAVFTPSYLSLRQFQQTSNWRTNLNISTGLTTTSVTSRSSLATIATIFWMAQIRSNSVGSCLKTSTLSTNSLGVRGCLGAIVRRSVRCNSTLCFFKSIRLMQKSPLQRSCNSITENYKSKKQKQHGANWPIFSFLTIQEPLTSSSTSSSIWQARTKSRRSAREFSELKQIKFCHSRRQNSKRKLQKCPYSIRIRMNCVVRESVSHLKTLKRMIWKNLPKIKRWRR